NENNQIISSRILASGGNYNEAGNKVLEDALNENGLTRQDLTAVFATGQGASRVTSDRDVNEITAQGRALSFLFPDIRTVIDIGGQATRVSRVDEQGRVTDFAISEKCATGSGRFLQVMGRVLQVELSDMGQLSLKSINPVKFGTSCAVFAESEAISRITEGMSKEDIIAGLHNSMAAKIYNLIQRIKLEKKCGATGGGALDIGLVKSLEGIMDTPLLVPPEPQNTAALGAALIAREMKT
ncbi:MAG: 2-hydroxyglutaryl-CoA dehydratase, partial [Deltaproteobacteria bacterium]|nr:2-hydroxyglutaryl-CoA dehydratase [Deltaproteobacteria bacterium]